jgi:hypothetical protein
VAVLVVAGCGGGHGGPSGSRADPPARPPPGWRTVLNSEAGLTVAAPRTWTARTEGDATLIRSKDRLVVVTLAADRSREGRATPPARYVRATLEQLPGFEGSVSVHVRRIPGSPYENARVDGAGTVRTSARPTLITVVAYRRPSDGTYTAVVFRSPAARSRASERRLGRLLETLRARPRSA